MPLSGASRAAGRRLSTSEPQSATGRASFIATSTLSGSFSLIAALPKAPARVCRRSKHARTSHAPGLDRHRGGARLYRLAVHHSELWRSRARPLPADQAAHLSPVARDLLHLMD